MYVTRKIRVDDKGRQLKKGEGQRKDGRYFFRFEHPITKKKYDVYDWDLDKLRTKEAEIELKFFDGSIENFELRNATLNFYFNSYIRTATLSPGCIYNYKRLWQIHVENSLGQHKLNTIKASYLREFFFQLSKKGYARNTIKYIGCIISNVFQIALMDDIIMYNPMTRVKLHQYGVSPIKLYSLTLAQQESLLNFVDTDPHYSRYAPIFYIMLYTALRAGELIGLVWENVDLDEMVIKIDHQLSYKNHGDGYRFYLRDPKTEAGKRVIPIIKPLRKYFIMQKQIQMSSGVDHEVTVCGLKNFVFTGRNSLPIMPAALNNLLYNTVKEHNKKKTSGEVTDPLYIKKFSAHVLRHTACTRMAESGLAPKALQAIMGHTDMATTMDVYNHATALGYVKKEAEKLTFNYKY